MRTIEEDKDYLEEKLAKLRESTRFRVAQSRALGIDLPGNEFLQNSLHMSKIYRGILQILG